MVSNGSVFIHLSCLYSRLIAALFRSLFTHLSNSIQDLIKPLVMKWRYIKRYWRLIFLLLLQWWLELVFCMKNSSYGMLVYYIWHGTMSLYERLHMIHGAGRETKGCTWSKRCFLREKWGKTLFLQIFRSSQVVDIITINSWATFDTH